MIDLAKFLIECLTLDSRVLDYEWEYMIYYPPVEAGDFGRN